MTNLNNSTESIHDALISDLIDDLPLEERVRVANLQQAKFNGADLRGAKNLTTEQLRYVKTLYKAKLDPDLMEQVKKCCPHLLEKPKEETEKSK